MSIRSTLIRRFFGVAGLWLTLVLTGGAVICRLEAIQGFSAEGDRAKKYVGHETTSDVKQIKIFLTQQSTPSGPELYAHSNFISAGAANPTKLAFPASSFGSVRELVGNLVYTEADAFQRDTLHTAGAIRENIQFFVDDAFFTAAGVPALDLRGVAKVTHADGFGGRFDLVPTGSPRGPPFMARLTDSLHCKFRPGSNPGELLIKLRSADFAESNFSFLNLIEETPVENALAEANLAQRASPVGKPLTEEGILEAIRTNRNKVLVTLFHSDGANLIVENSAGTSQVRVPLAKISAVAREAGCTLIGLGCNSGRGEVAAGALESFNPVEAVRSVKRALGSSSLAEFAESLTGDRFRLVFDETLLDTGVAFETFDKFSEMRAALPGLVRGRSAIATVAVRPVMVGMIVLPAATGQGTGDPAAGSGIKPMVGLAILAGLAVLIAVARRK